MICLIQANFEFFVFEMLQIKIKSIMKFFKLSQVVLFYNYYLLDWLLVVLKTRLQFFRLRILWYNFAFVLKHKLKFSPILSSEFPQRKVHFPPSAFSRKSSILISANFKQTQKLNNSSKFYYYKEYSLKVHVSKFQDVEKLTFRGG